MSEPEQDAGGLKEEADAAPFETESKERRSREEREPMKVVDRRFWVKQKAGDAQETPVTERSHYPKYVEELQGQLEDARSRLRELTAAYRRLQQEGEEVRLRLDRELERKVTVAKADLFRDLLDVADNLERALGVVESDPTASDLERGVGQVLAQLRRLLETQGIEEVEVMGREFDPEVAEAIEVRNVDRPQSDGAVIHVLQRGYRYCGRTLRPARVVVGKAVPLEEPRSETPQAGEAPQDE
jgi:molecular chaperone GrpE (heat shock protein)